MPSARPRISLLICACRCGCLPRLCLKSMRTSRGRPSVYRERTISNECASHGLALSPRGEGLADCDQRICEGIVVAANVNDLTEQMVE